MQATRAYAEDIQQEKSSESYYWLFDTCKTELWKICRLCSNEYVSITILGCPCMQELVRREVSKQQGGFSFVFLVIIALLGILLGYIVKK
ncbi:hypothetical protein BHE74_00015505 [Ensete ventricosum]|nr:hypothetical protein BHE74_00015505 [Ensete ventricosum]